MPPNEPAAQTPGPVIACATAVKRPERLLSAVRRSESTPLSPWNPCTAVRENQRSASEAAAALVSASSGRRMTYEPRLRALATEDGDADPRVPRDGADLDQAERPAPFGRGPRAEFRRVGAGPVHRESRPLRAAGLPPGAAGQEPEQGQPPAAAAGGASPRRLHHDVEAHFASGSGVSGWLRSKRSAPPKRETPQARTGQRGASEQVPRAGRLPRIPRTRPAGAGRPNGARSSWAAQNAGAPPGSRSRTRAR